MIESFRHAGLKKFFLIGSKAGIQPSHACILADQPTLLNETKSPEQMNDPTTFAFDGEDAILVDYRDYH